MTPVAEATALDERDALRASLRVLLDWCETFLNDEKHLIGSICKEADDAQFKAAIEQARTAIEEAIPASSVCTTCGELYPQGCCTCGPRQRLA